MSYPKILVTGATGKTGSLVVEELCDRNFSVRAFVHKEHERSARLAQLGAEIRVGDIYNFEHVLAAQMGAERAYFCPPVQPFMIHAALVFAAATKASGLKFVAQISQWLASPAHPSIHTRQLWQVEKLFASLPGVAHTVINPGVFADSILQVTPAAANLGVFPNVFGDLRNAPPSNHDMARVIAAVLAEPELHAGQRYRSTSAASVTMGEIAAAMGRATGRSVKLQDLPPIMFLKAAKAADASDFEITNVRHYIADGKRGVFGINAITGGLGQLTGVAPETIDVIARRYAARPEARRTLVALMREAIGMARVLAARPLDADAYDRRQEFPQPRRPVLAADSAIWAREHARQPGPGEAEFEAA